jgi:hypothetical protein
MSFVIISSPHGELCFKYDVGLPRQEFPELPIVIDSGASVSVTLHIRDFRGLLQKCPTKTLAGLSSGMEVLGMGQVTWDIQDIYGFKRQITTMMYYIPKANIRLFSPRLYCYDQNDGSYPTMKDTKTLTLCDGTHIVFPYQPGNKLHIMLNSWHFNNPITKVGLTFEDTNM